MKTKNPWIAAIFNFFLMGAGYIYNGKRVFLGVGFTIGAIVYTYVELHLKEVDVNLYWMMFAATLLINTCFAIDGYREAKIINNEMD